MNWIWDETEMKMRKQIGTFIKTVSLVVARLSRLKYIHENMLEPAFFS